MCGSIISKFDTSHHKAMIQTRFHCPRSMSSRYTTLFFLSCSSFFLQTFTEGFPYKNSACCLCVAEHNIGPFCSHDLNLLTPNDDYSGRTAPLTSKCCILYIYSTNIGTEYFKHYIYSPFFPLQNAVCFINLTYLVPVLFTFYIQSLLKLKK